MTKHLGLFVVVVLASRATTDVAAQSPSAAIPDAVQSTIGPWCREPVRMDSVAVPWFPDVRFKRGTCHDEHGDQLGALVGLDRDSVLYLLTSAESFNFLVQHHPLRTPIDSSQALGYARMVLELSGQVGPSARIVSRWQDFPSGVQDSARQFSSTPFYRTRQGDVWSIRLFTIEDGVFGPYINGFDVAFEATGGFASARRGWHWQRRPGP